MRQGIKSKWEEPAGKQPGRTTWCWNHGSRDPSTFYVMRSNGGIWLIPETSLCLAGPSPKRLAAVVGVRHEHRGEGQVKVAKLWPHCHCDDIRKPQPTTDPWTHEARPKPRRRAAHMLLMTLQLLHFVLFSGDLRATTFVIYLMNECMLASGRLSNPV